MKLRWLIILVLVLAGCSSTSDYKNPPWNAEAPTKRAMQWLPISQQAGQAWGVSPRLITAIIAVESGGNPTLVSKSNAVGLMQLKASTAGREVYRYMGWKGQPSTSELKNPERNISMGTAYLSILEHGVLKGIEDPEVMQYALVVSYVNGAGALLRTFSSDRKAAIDEINDLSPDEFIEHVAKHHPAPQAPRYLWKIQQAMNAM
ncbi:membrane-bound lytic murein transglycosylase EmtA [Franconibacter helveticus 513]|uniref:membrane-bound lytic murein transglycosylase EmtA n=1 Tax=Franconibacter helveticus TaxID=357240 RepID=UPI0004213B15|nr:membrane-bound lytic murein transglycosylase EmtA [Franconibacter helveticus]MDU6923732.1 membrane-bound lytic murein transglycosylase EmtA [Franconibacter helveticus]